MLTKGLLQLCWGVAALLCLLQLLSSLLQPYTLHLVAVPLMQTCAQCIYWLVKICTMQKIMKTLFSTGNDKIKHFWIRMLLTTNLGQIMLLSLLLTFYTFHSKPSHIHAICNCSELTILDLRAYLLTYVIVHLNFTLLFGSCPIWAKSAFICSHTP